MNAIKQELAHIATTLYERGWMWGTAGNLSARTDDGIWITASGVNKGALGDVDFIKIDAHGATIEAPKGKRCSAETTLHLTVYQHFHAQHACLHVHTIASNLVCQIPEVQIQKNFPKWLNIPPLEMVKGLGIWLQNPKCAIPIFPNHLHIPQIASELSSTIRAGLLNVPGFLIEHHGLTVWGKDINEALNRLECFAYILKYIQELNRLK